MKRAGQPAPYGGPKKARGGDSDDDFGGSQTTFEEDLMAMDEYLDDPELLADLDGSPEHQEKRWARPSAENYDPKTTDLAFQWMDIDMYSAREPLRVNPSGAAPVGSLNPPVPIVRMYGVTQDGRSVLAHIHGFTPYFYVALPPSADLSDSALMNLRKTLDLKVRNYRLDASHSSPRASHPFPPSKSTLNNNKTVPRKGAQQGREGVQGLHPGH